MPLVKFLWIVVLISIPLFGFTGIGFGQTATPPPSPQQGSGGILAPPPVRNQQPQQPQQPTQPLQPWQEQQQIIVSPSKPQTYGQQSEAQKNLQQRQQGGYRMDPSSGRLY